MKIAILPGDGIGKEVTAQAVKVIRAVIGSSVPYELAEGRIGGDAFAADGEPLPQATLDLASKADAILLGGTGVPEDEARPAAQRAGRALLRLRKELELFANYRPVHLFPELVAASTFKREVVEDVDILILRELNGDLYFGEPRGFAMTPSGARAAFNTMRYSEPEIARIAHVAFKEARRRRGKLCSIDKANVLETMELWRRVTGEVAQSYPDVELTNLYVDAALMSLMRTPLQFDVIVTGNMFGDIISDAAAMLAGSIGMLPSASLGASGKGLYEPVHGTAPDIAGKDIANPLAAILSAAMMFRHSFAMPDHAGRIEAAVRKVLADGLRTLDILEPGGRRVGTEEMGEAVAETLRKDGTGHAGAR